MIMGFAWKESLSFERTGVRTRRRPDAGLLIRPAGFRLGAFLLRERSRAGGLAQSKTW